MSTIFEYYTDFKGKYSGQLAVELITTGVNDYPE